MSATPSASVRPIWVYNTLTRSREELITREPGAVSFYSCGPTVYDLIHVGNLRAAMTADLVARHLKHAGYRVHYVRNFTDIDDKIIAKAKSEGISSAQVAQKYIREVELDFAAAGVLRPSQTVLVTEHLPEIISMVQKILDRGQGYVVDGEVLFEISTAPDYGKLSHKKIDDLIAGHRVEPSSKKRNPLDFTLWKPAKPDEPSWDSPWGPGRPGWHIECSAMACKWLGPQMDMHHGGEDLVFPHHENEIAQSEAASGQVPAVRYWIHNAFLTFNKDKMSKSLGNVFQAREFLTRYGSDLARVMLLSSHYRSMIDFSAQSFENARAALVRIYQAKKLALSLVAAAGRARADLRAEAVWGEFVATVENGRKLFIAAMDNDFQTPAAFAALFSVIRELNRAAAEPLARATPSAALGGQAFLNWLAEDWGAVVGIGMKDPDPTLQHLDQVVWPGLASDSAKGGSEPLSDSEIGEWIEKRKAAKLAKDFATADAIRKDLEMKGIQLKDTPSGTSWSRRG